MQWLRKNRMEVCAYSKRRRVPYELMGVAKAHLRGVVNGECPGHFLQLKQCLV